MKEKVEKVEKKLQQERKLWLLTDHDTKKLVSVLLDRRGDEGATEKEIETVLSWANTAKVQEHLFRMILEGETVFDVDEDLGLRFYPIPWRGD